MLDAFYAAFGPACFALLGLWLVVVQVRLREWQGSAMHRRRSYGVALHFALPGVMSLIALVDPADPAYWRVSFAVVALGGAVVLAMVGGLPVRSDRAGGRQASRLVGGQLGLAAYLVAIGVYVLIGALAVAGGRAVLRAEAVLLITQAFLGFNAAWLLLFDDSQHAQAEVAGHEHALGQARGEDGGMAAPAQP